VSTDTLFGHLAQQFSAHPENLATQVVGHRTNAADATIDHHFEVVGGDFRENSVAPASNQVTDRCLKAGLHASLGALTRGGRAVH
jgi:hypothetical protein